MPKQATAANPESRLSIRANSTQKSVLARAASVRHMNISQFVLGVSLREAEKIIRDESQIIVSSEEYEWLVKLMDNPPPAPRLQEELNKKPLWDV